MTRETAKIKVEQLDNYLSHACQDYGERDHEAMMMAIKALEQEPILDKLRAETIEKYWDCDICKWKSGHYLIRGDISDILQIIDKYKAESEDKK